MLIYRGPHLGHLFEAHGENLFQLRKFLSGIVIVRSVLKMASWNLRRSLVNYKEKASDAGERLRRQLSQNNYLDIRRINTLMNSLPDATATNISAAIQRAECSKQAAQTLIDVLLNEKKLKESGLKVNTHVQTTKCYVV